MTHLLINAEDLLGALEEQRPCPECSAGLGVHVEGGDWAVVVLHSMPCPATARPRTLRLVDTDSHRRCRSCGGLLMVDIGGGLEGDVEVVEACPRCNPRPGIYDTWGAS